MKLKFILMLTLGLILSSWSVMAWEFNGTTYDINGTALNNTLVNVTIWEIGQNGMTYVGSNFSRSFNSSTHGSGWFAVNVTDKSGWFYKPVVTHTNLTYNTIDYIGQSLPAFPITDFNSTSALKFYLNNAGTINITVINSTSGHISFNYMVKDAKLGYDIASNWLTAVNQSIVNVPINRNYSIMIFPANSMPLSFDWNNFSSNSSYIFSNNAFSMYNVTTRTLNKQFNVSQTYERLSGYINGTSLGVKGNWSNFHIIVYLLEPGNMLFSSNGAFPYNMSAWNATPGLYHVFDNFSLGDGFYNITLPAPAESATYLLFATAKNNTWLGSYKNITLSYGTAPPQTNFTMYGLLGSASNVSHITLYNAQNWDNTVNLNTSKHTFSIVNSSNQQISTLTAHIEVTVDYSNYGTREFTFMTDISTSTGTFRLPLLNVTGTKEINIYSTAYSPKSVQKKTAAELANNSNITLLTFNPTDISGSLSAASIGIALYKSNSTCDLPGNELICSLVDSTNMDNFNPLSSIIGGGAISFRMGLLTTGIIVHYVNVDMLASGPPDALFDSSTSESTSGGFSSALRFGSAGPTIYDSVLISMPYTQGSTSATGLNEDAEVNFSINTFYDENWNIIWNTTTNGTNASNLAANYTHYAARESEWQILMKNNTCVRNVSQFNSSSPCYLNTSDNRIWIRMPHFSGTSPSITGSSITASSSSSSSSSASGGSGGSSGFNDQQVAGEYAKKVWYSINPTDKAIVTVENGEIGITEIDFSVNEKVFSAWVKVTKKDVFPGTVQGFSKKIYKIIEISTAPSLKEEILITPMIKFKVKKSWLAANELNKKNVAMFRYVNGNWGELKTTLGKDDSEYVHYSAETPGFSYFVIAEKTVKEPIAKEIIKEVEPVIKEVVEEVPEKLIVEEVSVFKKIWFWVVIILGLLIAAGMVYYFTEHK